VDSSSDLLDRLRADLADEVRSLADVVDHLDEDALRTPTPADGWDVADELAHLAAFDDFAVLALNDPFSFSMRLESAMSGGVDPIAEATDRGRSLGPIRTRDWWHDASSELAGAASILGPRTRLAWFGPDMGAVSFLTARLMETWAHGQDVRDALGLDPEVSARLRHIAEMGVRARAYSYSVRGMDPPAVDIAVVLDAPDGTTWTWGAESTTDRVSGSALDFCLLVTQRRHRDDLALVVHGDEAERWVGIAQAFAGGAGPGRPRRS